MMLSISMKFHDIILNGFQAIEWTWLHDGWTDGRTDNRGKHNMSPYLSGGDIMTQNIEYQYMNSSLSNLAYSCDHLALYYTYSNNTHSSKKHLPSFPSCTHAHTHTNMQRERQRETEREREWVSERDRERQRLRQRDRDREREFLNLLLLSCLEYCQKNSINP